MTVSPAESNDTSLPSLENLKGWKLEDAKARFSEVVRLARENAPQRITVRGEDAVVVLQLGILLDCCRCWSNLVSMLCCPNRRLIAWSLNHHKCRCQFEIWNYEWLVTGYQYYL